MKRLATTTVLLACLAMLLAPCQQARAVTPATATARAFNDDDLLLLEVLIGQRQVTDGLGTYSSRAGLFLPLGELSRLLDLPILVDPPARKAEGWFLSESRRISVQPDRNVALVEGRSVALDPGSVVLMDDDLYVRVDVLQKLLPLTLKADLSALSLVIVPREHLPFEERLEREHRRSRLATGGSRDEATQHVENPYDWVSPPAFDLNATVGYGNDSEGRTTQWVLRAAGDLALTQARAFLSSDAFGAPESMRLEFNRQFGGSESNAPWRVAAGDIFSPTLPLGISGHAGRGFSASNEPLSLANVFDQVNLRGELPSGYEVELYVNEVLRGSQSNGLQGRYEFLGVPLSYGLNIVRLAFYGPRGERYEEVKRLNVGGGQLAAGQSTMNVGAVDAGTTLFQLRAPTLDPRLFDRGYGTLQFSGAYAYGLTSTLTGRLNFGQYSPIGGTPRQLAGGGLSTNLAGIAVQFDGATDSQQGHALALGLAGRLLNVPLLARHVEYHGAFIDEREPGALDIQHPLARVTSIRADISARLPGTRRVLPLSLDWRRQESIDGSTQDSANARATLLISRLLASANFGYFQTRAADGNRYQRLGGSFDVGTLSSGRWAFRASTSYNLQPEWQLVGSSLTADHRLKQGTVLRFGVTQGWTEGGTTGITAGATWRLTLIDLTLNGAYIPQLNQYSISLGFAIGTLFDPVRRRYVSGGPDSAGSGALSLDAWIDRDGNGQRGADEPGVAGIGSQSGRGTRYTDGNGRLLATGLADGNKSTLSLRVDGVDDPYLLPPSTRIEVTPRAGKVVTLGFPLRQTGEVALRVMMQLAPGSSRGIAALDIELVDSVDRVVGSARTEYDGTALFEGLPAGEYSARIRPEQAQRLKLQLTKMVQIKIPLQGGFVGTQEIDIELVH